LLMRFYHRSFREAVETKFVTERMVRKDRYAHLATVFARQPWTLPSTAETEPTLSDPPNARKTSELPWHQLQSAENADPGHCKMEVWDPVVTTLCDMRFIEAKCRAGQLFELQADNRNAIEALPEAQTEIAERRRLDGKLAFWAKQVIKCTRKQRKGCQELAREDPEDKSGPLVPNALASVRLQADRQIAAARKQDAVVRPRLARLQTVAGFLALEYDALVRHGSKPGFSIQHVRTCFADGFMHDAAKVLSGQMSMPWLRRCTPFRATPITMSACLHVLNGHRHRVLAVTTTLDGQRVVSYDRDWILRVWDMTTGVCLRSIPHPALTGLADSGSGGPDRVTLGVTPDGSQAVVLRAESRIGERQLIYGLESGTCEDVAIGNSYRVAMGGTTPAGCSAFPTCSGMCAEWTPTTQRRVEEARRAWAMKTRFGDSNGFSVTPDGRLAVAIYRHRGLHEDKVVVWCLRSSRCLRILQSHDVLECVCVTGDGRRAVTGGTSLRIWDLEAGSSQPSVKPHRGPVRYLKVVPYRRSAVSACKFGDSRLVLWDTTTGKPLRTLSGRDQEIRSFCVTPDGRGVVSGHMFGMVRYWSLRTGLSLCTFNAHDSAESMCMMPDNANLVTAFGCARPGLRVLHLRIGRSKCVESGVNVEAWAVAALPEGQYAAVIRGGRIEICNIGGLTTVHETAASPGNAFELVVSPDGRFAATAFYGGEGAICVWDLRNGALLHSLARKGKAYHVCITPDGMHVVGEVAGAWWIWNLSTGQEVAVFRVPDEQGGTGPVDVTPAGRLVCGTGNGDVLMFDCVNIHVGPALVTASSLRDTGRFWRRPLHHARCPVCSCGFGVNRSITDAIETYCSSLDPRMPSCISVPNSAFDDVSLLSECPHCHSPLKFNPFFAQVETRM